MIKHYPYRFKTEEEFIKQYGREWRYNNSSYNFVQGMDYLLGRPYPFDVKLNDLLPHFKVWGISWNFLTSNEPLEPTYKPKEKIIRTI